MTVTDSQIGDRYQLGEKVGSGGMSSVYRAFDPTLERWVAIKMMHRDITSDPDQLERFRREARAVAQLNHPHVVTVIDAGEDDGTPYIVLEYVEGETLKDRIRRMGRLPVSEAVAYAIEIGRALSCAHANRLVHRDIKPQNVLIAGDGRAKVTDFGIARSLEAHGLTAAGRVLGTTDYVSPEQALGHDVTQQSDLYSLGIVLYEMLTGEPPFRADTQVAVAMKHVKEPLPDVQRLRPEISAALAAVVDRATAKETRNRYATADEMVHDLEEVLGIEAARAGEATGEATTILRSLPGDTADFAPERLRHPRRTLVLGVAAIALVAGGLAFLGTRTEKGAGGSVTPGSGRLTEVRLGQNAASDYDPQGDDKQEYPDAARFAIDGIRPTNWETETYQGGQWPGGKTGVGLYVDADHAIRARRLDLVSSTPGFQAAVYGSASGVPTNIGGWKPLTAPATVGEEKSFTLGRDGRRYRYYLVWITKLPESGKARIQELGLKR